MALTTDVRDALHAGIPVLSKLRIKQNRRAQRNVDHCRSIVMSAFGGLRVGLNGCEKSMESHRKANVRLISSPSRPAAKVTNRFSVIS